MSVGLGAALLQQTLLRYGALPGEQWGIYFAFYAIAGLVAALVGDALGGLIARRPGGLLAAGLIVPLVGFAAFLPANVRTLPHVVLLVTDTTRADHLSLYGYERGTTPTLTRLASESVVFTNSVSQGSHTIVTTPSILSSTYPSEHGMSRYRDVLPAKLPLLPELLREAGYGTYGFATNPHLAPDRGYARGFDTYEYEARWQNAPARRVNARFLRWLDSQEEGPIFAFLFYLDPHSPYRAPPPFGQMFDPQWAGDPVTRWLPEWGVPAPSSPRLRNLIAQYDGAIAYWDAELERLLKELRRRDAFDDAILVYTSDHGEEFFEHGSWGHNRTLFEESIHVPLLISLPVPIRFPRLRRISRVVPQVASSVDILPTILEVIGLDPLPTARGTSLLPLILGETEGGAERVAFNEEILHSYGPYDVRGVRARDHKYVRVLDYEGDRTPRDLFFDLRTDPGEQQGVRDRDDDRREALRELLESKLAEMEGAPAPVNASVPLDPRRLEALKALGYIGEPE